MDTFCHAGEPGMYRAATGTRTLYQRGRLITLGVVRPFRHVNDTNAALALAASIAQVDALTCAEFFRDNEAFRE
jgi:hypothetical protein